MIYTERKTEEGYEYKNEDLYGWTTINSQEKLDPDTLDQIVCQMVMEKKIKKGHTDTLRFEAQFKDQWSEDEEEEIKISLKQKIKEWLINLIKRI